MAAMCVNGSEQNKESLERTFHRYFLASFNSFGQAVTLEKNFKKSPNHKKELSVVAMFETGSVLNVQPL